MCLMQTGVCYWTELWLITVWLGFSNGNRHFIVQCLRATRHIKFNASSCLRKPRLIKINCEIFTMESSEKPGLTIFQPISSQFHEFHLNISICLNRVFILIIADKKRIHGFRYHLPNHKMMTNTLAYWCVRALSC